jgi:hypothetical protein
VTPTNQNGFLLSYTFAVMARELRLMQRRNNGAVPRVFA